MSDYAEQTKDSILGFIIDFKRHNDGLSPTIRQIQKYMEFASSNTIWRWLEKLDAEGKIIRTSSGIKIPGGQWYPANLPKETINND